MWTLADSFFNWQILGIWQILKWDSLFQVSLSLHFSSFSCCERNSTFKDIESFRLKY